MPIFVKEIVPLGQRPLGLNTDYDSFISPNTTAESPYSSGLAGERADMQSGYFDDKAREYVITRPDTPLPWINYLSSRVFFSLICNTGSGYCINNDAR